MRTILSAVLAVAGLAAVPAGAITYTTGDAHYTDLGQQPTGDGVSDQVDFAGLTGDITGPGTYALNTVTFTVGYTGPSAITESGVYTDTVMIGGNSYNYDVNYSLDSYYVDTLTLGGNSAMLGDYLVTVDPLVLVGGYDGTFYSPDPATLTFTITEEGAVPEPASWALMISGFGLVGGTLRRRQTVSFAA